MIYTPIAPNGYVLYYAGFAGTIRPASASYTPHPEGAGSGLLLTGAPSRTAGDWLAVHHVGLNYGTPAILRDIDATSVASRLDIAGSAVKGAMLLTVPQRDTHKFRLTWDASAIVLGQLSDQLIHPKVITMQYTPKSSPFLFALKFLDTEPHPAQRELLECRAEIKLACCGRRWGKSTAAAIEALWFAITHPGTVQFIIAPTSDQASIIFDMIVDLIEKSPLRPLLQKVVRSPFPEMTLLAGDGQTEVESRILVRSAGHDGKFLRGHGADQIIVDEVAYMPEPIMTQVIPPMLAASEHKRLILLSTPFGLNHFYDVFQRGQSGDPSIRSFHFPSHTNPHLDPAYLERQRQELTEAAYAVEYGAEFAEDQASVFKAKFITAAIDSSIETGAVLAGHEYVIGFDPAKYTDRSGVVVLDVTATPFQVVEILDIGGRGYLPQAATVRRLAERYHEAPVLLDATAHDQMLEQLQHDGVQAEGFKFTHLSKRVLIDGLILAFEHGELKLPPHPDLQRELQYYRFERTASGNVKLGAPDRPGMHDDLVTALALAVQKGKAVADIYVGWVDFGDPVENRLRQLHPNLPESAVDRFRLLDQGMWPFPAYYRGNIRRFLG